MITQSPTIRMVFASLIAFTLLLTLSFAQDNTRTAEAYKGQPSTTIRLTGSGSSFLYPQLAQWISLYTSEYPGVRIEYSPTGSGTGQRMLFDRVVDFAGSDPPLKREEWNRLRGEVAQVPVVLGAVAIVYNLPGVEEPLNLTPRTLALIFKGEVEYWDDPLIRESNPGARLPHEPIIVVHRSDSSGTTRVLTEYLHQLAPKDWVGSLVGKSIEWPVDTLGRGVGGKGNQGVLDALLSTPGSIGYLEASYAMESGLGIARVQNPLGEFVAPTRESVTLSALGALEGLPGSVWGDWSGSLSLLVAPHVEGAYPISSFSFLMFWKPTADSPEGRALVEFVEWVLTEGQEHIVEGYAPLPPQLAERLVASLGIVQGAGGGE